MNTQMKPATKFLEKYASLNISQLTKDATQLDNKQGDGIQKINFTDQTAALVFPPARAAAAALQVAEFGKDMLNMGLEKASKLWDQVDGQGIFNKAQSLMAKKELLTDPSKQRIS